MDGKDLTICKLGGSVITFKDKPLTPNIKAITGLAKALFKYDGKLVIIHGGGSFGHYMASRFGLGQSPSKASPEAVALTRYSMLELHLAVLRIFLDVGLTVYSVPLSSMMNQRLPSRQKMEALVNYTDTGLIPMTFGDVVVSRTGSYIVSGDQIATSLSKHLRPRRVLFVLDVDGIYQDPKKTTLIRELKIAETTNLIFSKGKIDVTGGIERKIKEASRIANMGIDVSFVSGLVPQRVLAAAQGKNPIGTVLKGAESFSLTKNR